MVERERLKKLIEHARCCELYKSLPDVKKIEDLPFTEGKFLIDNPLCNLCDENIVEVHASSGSTSRPKLKMYNLKDLEIWGKCVAENLKCAGARSGDWLQIGFDFGVLTGAIGFHYGCQKAGMKSIPLSLKSYHEHYRYMEILNPRVLCCSPNFARYLAKYKQSNSWEIVLIGSEMFTEDTRTEIEEKLDVIALDNYGLSEIIGPGVAQECFCKNGLHVMDSFYPEIIEGELVLTTLECLAMPLLRYKTGDLVEWIDYSPCDCGLTSPRISRIQGRK